MRRPLIGFVLSALAFGALAGTAGSEPPSAVGWWTSTPGAGAAEDGGFEVAAVAGNHVSVAALRFANAAGGATATLTLTEAGGTVTPTTALQACPTTEPWEPANPGALDDAPEPDCTAAVPLTRDEEAATWTGSVSGILGAGTIMIVPGETPGGGSPLDVGFRVEFSGADLVVTTPSASGPSPTPAPLPSGGGSGGTSGGSSGGSSFPSSSPSPSPALSGAGPVTPTTVAAGGGTTVTTVAVDEGDASGGSEDAFGAPDLAPGATVGGGGSDQPWERLLFLVPLSALAGVLWIYAKRFLTQRGVLEEA
jgi:hypothetical protein